MKTNTTHTPGPWALDEVWNLIMGPNEEEVAAIHAAMPPAQGRDADKTKREVRARAAANAHLIAAAPDLLAALESNFNALSLARVALRDAGKETIDCLDRAIADNRAAIAKAEGR